MQHAWMRPSSLAAAPPKSQMVHKRAACVDLVCDHCVQSSARPKAGICSTPISWCNPVRNFITMKDVRPARSQYRTSATSDAQIHHTTETGSRASEFHTLLLSLVNATMARASSSTTSTWKELTTRQQPYLNHTYTCARVWRWCHWH